MMDPRTPQEASYVPEVPCLGMQELGYAGCLCMEQNAQLIEVEEGLMGAEPCLIEERKQLKAANAQLETALANKDIESKQDALTGLRNLRGLPEEFAKHVETGEKFGILFIDIENFKQINKSGHLAGDYALQFISNLLQLEFREEDIAFATHDDDEVLIRDKSGETSIIYRKGGDEFILFINHPDVDEAMMKELGGRFKTALKNREETKMYDRVAPADKQLGVHAKGMVYDPANPFSLETVYSQGDPKLQQQNTRFNIVEVIFRGAKEKTDAEVAEMHAKRAELAEQQHRRLDDEE